MTKNRYLNSNRTTGSVDYVKFLFKHNTIFQVTVNGFWARPKQNSDCQLFFLFPVGYYTYMGLEVIVGMKSTLKILICSGGVKWNKFCPRAIWNYNLLCAHHTLVNFTVSLFHIIILISSGGCKLTRLYVLFLDFFFSLDCQGIIERHFHQVTSKKQSFNWKGHETYDGKWISKIVFA